MSAYSNEAMSLEGPCDSSSDWPALQHPHLRYWRFYMYEDGADQSHWWNTLCPDLGLGHGNHPLLENISEEEDGTSEDGTSEGGDDGDTDQDIEDVARFFGWQMEEESEEEEDAQINPQDVDQEAADVELAERIAAELEMEPDAVSTDSESDDSTDAESIGDWSDLE